MIFLWRSVLMGAVFLGLAPGQVSEAGCRNTLVTAQQPLDYGALRYEPAYRAGWVSVWPDGTFQISRGIALGAHARVLPGQVRIRAVPGDEIVLHTGIGIPGYTGTDVAFSNVRLSAPGLLIREEGNYHFVSVPESFSGDETVEFSLYIGADLIIRNLKEAPGNLIGRVEIRCLASAPGASR